MQKAMIVVPCYNEADRLQPERFIEYAIEQPAVSFLFVDDGSSDATFRVLTTLSEAHPNMSVLRLEQNSGKAEAVRRGVMQAFDSGADLIGFWDADLATPLPYIERFAVVLERPESMMVFGSRVRLLGRRVERKAMRHYIGRGFATLASLALQLPVYDTQCGAKLFRANSMFRSQFSTPFELGWSFDVELFARLMRFARETGELDPASQLIEFPLEEWTDAPGSKVRMSHLPGIALELGKIFVIARRP